MLDEALPEAPTIESFEINSYKSCIHTSFKLQPDLSVLIGPNGTGKTNVLNAMALMKTMVSDEGIGRRESDEGSECNLEATFLLGGKRASLLAQLRIRTSGSNTDVILSGNHYWIARDFTGSRKRVKLRPVPSSPLWLDAYEPMPSEFMPFHRKIIRFLSSIQYYTATQFTNPSLCPVSFEVDEAGRLNRGDIGLQGQGHDRFLCDLYMANNSQKPAYREFINIIGPGGLDLIQDIEFNAIGTSSTEHIVKSSGDLKTSKKERKLVVPRFVVGNNKLCGSQLSEGTLKTIALLFYLITEESSALFIEEPEVCIHHGLLSSIIDLIKTYSKQKQIVISTHSDFVLDQIQPHQVYKVSNSKDEGTVVTQLAKGMTSKEVSALSLYLESEGNLGEYWRHGGLN